MIPRMMMLTAVLASSAWLRGQAFMMPNLIVSQSGVLATETGSCRRRPASGSVRGRRVQHCMSTSTDLAELGLTPELERLTKVFRSCPNDKMRQMQILHLAQMGEKFDEALMTEENKVLG